MGRKKFVHPRAAAAARARLARHSCLSEFPLDDTVDLTLSDNESAHNPDECNWSGSVNHMPSDCSDWYDSGNETKSDSEDFVELEGNELVESMNQIQGSIQYELEVALKETMTYEVFNEMKLTPKEWAMAENKRGFGYSGNSSRTQRRKGQQARQKADKDAELRQT
jgi:hypothetical protein